MMNLLIAITTAIYEDTMDNKEKSEYIQLCAVIYDFETLVFDICRDSNEKDEGRHLITAQKETEDQEWTEKKKNFREKIGTVETRMKDYIEKKFIEMTEETDKKQAEEDKYSNEWMKILDERTRLLMDR